MIKSTNQLSQRELNRVKQLLQLCKRVDGSAPNIYTHLLAQKRALPASLLYTNKAQQLLGFLSAYFFYHDACEVALFVAPLARKKGVGRKLIQEILPLVEMQGLSRLIFSCPGKLHDEWLKTSGFSYHHTEYHMERKHNHLIPVENFQQLDIRSASEDMISALSNLDNLCFPKEHNDNPTNYESLLQNTEEYKIFVLFQDEKIVGKAHLRMTTKGVTFSDIAINPPFQGKGFGSSLLAHSINYAIQVGKTRLVLDVEAKNDRALQIYLNFDFQVENTADYWTIPREKLAHLVKSSKET